jgi:hypothetical protein
MPTMALSSSVCYRQARTATVKAELLCMPAPGDIKEETYWPDSRVF